jgi:hypothetical protein
MDIFSVEKERKLKSSELFNIAGRGSRIGSANGPGGGRGDSIDKSNEARASGIFNNCSTKCLVIFSICAIIVIVICSIFMAIVTTSILIKAGDYNKELLKRNFQNLLKNESSLSLLSVAAAAAAAVASSGDGSPALASVVGVVPPSASAPAAIPPLSSSHADSGNNNNSNNNNSNKLERNVFSWITDTIKKSFLNSNKNFKTNTDVNDFMFSNDASQFMDYPNANNLEGR